MSVKICYNVFQALCYMFFMYYLVTASHPYETGFLLSLLFICRTYGLKLWNNWSNTIELVSRIQPGFEIGPATLRLCSTISDSYCTTCKHFYNTCTTNRCFSLMICCKYLWVLLKIDWGYLIIERGEHVNHDWDGRQEGIRGAGIDETAEILLWSLPHMLSGEHVQAWAKEKRN